MHRCCMHYSTYYHHPNTGDALYQLSLEVNCGVNPLFDARIYAITVAEHTAGLAPASQEIMPYLEIRPIIKDYYFHY